MTLHSAIDYRLHLYSPHTHFQSGPNPGYCRHQIHERGRGVGFYQCGKVGKYPYAKEDGLLYEDSTGVILFCEVHHPIRKKERREAQEAKWDKEHKVKTDRWDRIAAMDKLCEGMTNAQIEQFTDEHGPLGEFLENAYH